MTNLTIDLAISEAILIERKVAINFVRLFV